MHHLHGLFVEMAREVPAKHGATRRQRDQARLLLRQKNISVFLQRSSRYSRTVRIEGSVNPARALLISFRSSAMPARLFAAQEIFDPPADDCQEQEEELVLTAR